MIKPKNTVQRKPKSQNEGRPLRAGDTVITTEESYPVSRGTVKLISECGRYAVVHKKYGTREWAKRYKTADLKLVE